jgi:pimeloyl-ACP methyl ester carboxylesterase
MTAIEASLTPQARFARAYQDQVDHWPVPVTSRHVPTSYGLTHILACGQESSPAVLLLPGGGATAIAWRDLAARLSTRCRVIAPDPIGQPGPSTAAGQPMKTASDLTNWLDQLLSSLGITRLAIGGHSYGAWIALRYALHARDRVSHLALLDPAFAVASLSPAYRARAVPLLTRPSAARMQRFLAWETRGRPLDPGWLSVAAAGNDLGRAKIVLPRRPHRRDLAGLNIPVLVIAAGQSRAHNPAKILRRARARLQDVTTATIPQATHHTMPTQDVPELLDHLGPFLARGTASFAGSS